MTKEFNYVYITTNLINGKQYVGSHATNNIDDGYIGSGRFFLRAVKKEGKENFKREILEESIDREEALSREEFYISKFRTLCPNGYNMCPKGGIGFSGASHSSITKEKQAIWQKGKTFEELYGEEKAKRMKEKLSSKKIGKNTPRKGVGHKKELIKKYGEEEGIKRYNSFVFKQSKAKKGKNHPNWNKHLSLEVKERIKNSNKNQKKIECPYCHNKFMQGHYTRYHGEKCQQKNKFPSF